MAIGHLKQANGASDIWGICTYFIGTFWPLCLELGAGTSYLLIELLCTCLFKSWMFLGPRITFRCEPYCWEIQDTFTSHHRHQGGKASSSPAGLGLEGTRDHLPFPPTCHLRVAANVLILAGFIKPRSLEVGERIFSFHENLN